MTKEFDIVVHGATGFTGRLIAEYLLTRSDSGLKWAMGGRSMEKLQAVRDEIGAPASTPLVVIESSDEASLKSLMSKTRLVISAVGPYQLYGNELVKACAESGVDYVDLCGEPAWMRHMIDQHQSTAEMTKRVLDMRDFSEASSLLSMTTNGVETGAPISSRTACSLSRLRPPMAHLSPESERVSKYSAMRRPVKPVAPCTTMSNSLVIRYL